MMESQDAEMRCSRSSQKMTFLSEIKKYKLLRLKEGGLGIGNKCIAKQAYRDNAYKVPRIAGAMYRCPVNGSYDGINFTRVTESL